MGPVCLLGTHVTGVVEKKPPARESPLGQQRSLLEVLFQPLPYGHPGEDQTLFDEIRDRHEQMQAHRKPEAARSIPPTFGAFPYDHTYRLVACALPLEHEAGATPVHEYLEAAADALIGVGTISAGTIPVLYANARTELDQQARSTAAEMLVAAWCYLRWRYTVEAIKADPVLRRRASDLGDRLLDLEGIPDERMRELLREVNAVVTELDSEPAGERA